MQIRDIKARMVLDSRGNPTVEADVTLDNDIIGRAIVPSGASTGVHEAVELRDGGKNWSGKGVSKAIDNVNTEIKDALIGHEIADQRVIDNLLINLDGSTNKGRLGANALLSVSMAVAKARANATNTPLFQSLNKDGHVLPVPMMNVMNGGAHANNGISCQEFMIVPVGAKSFTHAMQMGTEIFHALKKEIDKAGMSTAVGDEGGFAPDLSSTRQALDFISDAVGKAGYNLGSDIVFALDVAASEIHKDGKYSFAEENLDMSSDQLIKYYAQLCRDYPIYSIEDGLDEDDWAGWTALNAELGDKIQLVGDDIFVTNPKRMQRGIDENCANALLVKMNQIGTITETLEAIDLAKSQDWGVVISHRSGETEDTFLADLAVATNAGQVKTGSLCRSDRMAKYNQFLRIEEILGDKAHYRTGLVGTRKVT